MIDIKRWKKVNRAIARKKIKAHSSYYCSKLEEMEGEKNAVLNLISIYSGKSIKILGKSCSEFVDKYLPSIMAKYEKSKPDDIKSKISNDILYYTGLKYVKHGKKRAHPSTLKGDSRKKVSSEIYDKAEDLYSDLKLYMESYEIKDFVHKNFDHEIGAIPVIDEKIELNVRKRCPVGLEEGSGADNGAR